MKQITLVTLAFFFTFLCSCKKDETTTPKETVLYQTSFSNDDGKWQTGTIANGSKAFYQNGQYWMEGSNGGVLYSMADNFFSGPTSKMTVEAIVKIDNLSTIPENGIGGLVWSAQSDYYVFMVTFDGYWRLGEYNRSRGEWVYFNDWVRDNNILLNDYNKLRIEQAGGTTRFYINDVQVHSMDAVNRATLDKLGFFVSASSRVKAKFFKTVQQNG
ncbi:hypothetical protein LL912_12360 [Niabella sp. CC-SYL272]|uniref:hypothetical protein n=1 Tax=Niabella agricola TaxID=2891571 RepID=UPI001F3A98A2|nr:hypothetical protein [Niabella agricola]MCF3109565.1 hypothetical protein [Niabella agricola]